MAPGKSLGGGNQRTRVGQVWETEKNAEVEVTSLDLCLKKEAGLMWHLRGVLRPWIQNGLGEPIVKLN